MPPEADLDLARRDGRVPGLRTVLDASALLDLLRRAHPDLPLDSARVRYVRYKPGTNCLAAFTVTVGDRTFHLHAKAWAGDHAGRLDLPAPSRIPPLDQPLHNVTVPEARLALRVFPADARLDSLPDWASPVRRAQLLERLGHHDLLDGATAFSVVAYKPERRCVARLERPDGTPVALLKTYAADGFEPARAAARALARPPGRHHRLPRLLGRSRRHQALVFEWIPGQLLDPAGPADARGLRAFADTGAALAEFQSTPPGGTPPGRLPHPARALPEHAALLGFLLPSLAPRAHDLATRLAARLAQEPGPEALVHGDFHPRQVLLTGDGPALLDLDNAGSGPAWLDPAHFVAHLELESLRHRLPFATARLAADTFLEAYSAASGHPAPHLPAWIAAALFSQAALPFRLRDPDWAEALARTLDRVAALLDEAPTRSPRASRTPLDPGMPLLDLALDPAPMERHLRALVPAGIETRGHRLTAATLLRHKPGRRALIEYTFEPEAGPGGFSWLGKVRARAGRDRAAALARRLRQAGLADPSDVAVPEPLGHLPEARITFWRRVPGRPVFPLLAGPEGPAAAARCAAAAHRLHTSGLAVARTHSVDDELAILDRGLAHTSTFRPDLAPRIDRVRLACHSLAARLTPPPPVLIHRDFYPDQLLLDDARTWLLDLDLGAMGDPAVDHGNFLAHLEEWSLRRFGRPDALGACATAYRGTVLAALAPLDPEAPGRIACYELLSLARHLHVATRFPDRLARLPDLLAWCEQRIDRFPPTSRLRVHPDPIPGSFQPHPILP